MIPMPEALIGSIRAAAAIAAFVSGGLLSPSTAGAQNADPADVASIDAIITAIYDVISGDAGNIYCMFLTIASFAQLLVVF